MPGLGRSPGEGIGYPLQYFGVSLVAQLVKNPPAMQETGVRSLGWEDPPEKGKASHSSILAWRIPWTVHGVAKSRTQLSDFHFTSLHFTCGSAGKESSCTAGDLGSIPGLGRSPGEGKGYPLHYFGLENSADCIDHGLTESRTPRDFHFFTVLLSR